MAIEYTFDNAGITTTIVVEAVSPDDPLAGWMTAAEGGAHAIIINGKVNAYGFGPATMEAAKGAASMLRAFRNVDEVDIDSLPLD